jgi:ParB family chromosome partitioning protein
MSLGRGLSALITPSAPTIAKQTPTASADGKIWEIPLTNLKPSLNQPRKFFKPDELQELADSIKQYGVLEPLLVEEKTDGGYEIIAGERRYRASKLAGLTTVPVIVKKLAPVAKLEVALIENIQRADLNPLEEAFAYRRLMEEFGLTQQQVAEKVGKSRPVIANAVRLLDLPNPVQTALIEGKINMTQARTLLALEKPEDQLSMLGSMLGEKITVRELEQKVALHQGGSLAPERRDPNVTYLEGQLRTTLGAKVTISNKGEKGTITISYHSKEELGDLVKKITE